MTQKKVSAVIYAVLVIICAFALGYLLGKNGSSKDVTISVAQTAFDTDMSTGVTEQMVSTENAEFPTAAEAIDLNTATQEELESLPGIGPVLAQRIIEYRQDIGKFKTKEQIKNVKGIGDKTYEQLRNLIKVGGEP